MRFIAQVALSLDLGGPGDVMAYLFMTEPWPERADVWVDGTDNAEGGENAVILQPGAPPPVETLPQATGPTLFRWVDSADGTRQVQPCEFHVTLEAIDESDVRASLPTEQAAAHFERLQGTKLGGLPAFLQPPEFPLGEDAQLLLQIDSEDVPFWINFGDGGVGYVVVSPDARTGRFLWQGL
jgi:hypothetical protein